MERAPKTTFEHTEEVQRKLRALNLPTLNDIESDFEQRREDIEEYTGLLEGAGWTYRQTWYLASKLLGVVEGVKDLRKGTCDMTQ